MKRNGLTAATLILVSTGCTSSPVLNEGRAKTLIQESLQSQGYIVSIAALTPLMSPSTNDYRALASESRTIAAISQLITEKFVTQTATVLSYPNISGLWVAESQGERYKNYYKMDLQVGPGSNRVTGTCEHQTPYGPAYQYKGNISGTVNSNGSIELEATVACFEAGHPIGFEYSEDGTAAFLQQVTWGHELRYSAHASSRINLTQYSYSFSPSVTVSPTGVDGGRFEVGDITDLQLAAETSAVANFSWQVSLNRVGQIILGDAKPTGRGTSQFAKKPDGTWVLVMPLRF